MKKILALLLLIAFSPYAFAVAPDIRISDADGHVVNVTEDGKLSVDAGVSSVGDSDSDDSIVGGTYAKQAFDPNGLNGYIRYFVPFGQYQNGIDIDLDYANREVALSGLNGTDVLSWNKYLSGKTILGGGTRGVPTYDFTSITVNYYDFEETSGTSVAATIGSDTGTVSSGTIQANFSAPGHTGNGFKFSGTNGIDFGTAAGNKFTGDFTVCAMARSNISNIQSGNQRIAGNNLGSGTNVGWEITMVPQILPRGAISRFSVDIGASNIIVVGDQEYDDGSWHVLCGRRDGDTISHWFDGVSTGTPQTGATGSLAGAGNTRFAGTPQSGYTMQGYGDKFATFSDNLSDAEILALSNYWLAGGNGVVVYPASGPHVFSTTTVESSSYATDGDDMIVGDDLDVQGDAHASNYFSGDGTQGMTGSCAEGTSLTVKDGLITACA